MPQAPVALFVYNRPVHTRQTVEALLRNEGAAETDLFVFSDGPKSPESAGPIRELREYARSIQGFRSVSVVERPQNLGLRASVVDGVTRLCAERGRVIVLEDDLLSSPGFLEFMNRGLDTYESEEQVMQIAGYMFPTTVVPPEDALFMPFVTSWGWATWQRAWRHFDPAASGYDRLAADPALRSQFDLNGHYKYFKLLKAQKEGRGDSWAILWWLSVFGRRGLALFPRQTLIHNIGFDGSGANKFVRTFQQDSLQPEFRVVSLPRSVAPSPLADRVIRGLPSPKLTLGSIFRKLGALLNLNS
jgi:hypothetical protein